MEKYKYKKLKEIIEFRLNLVNIISWEVGVKGINMIVARKWDGIQELNLFGNNLGDEGTHIITKRHWQSLTKLYLRGNDISNEGVVHLSRLTAPELQILSISDNHITEVGLLPFRKSRLYILRYLIVGYNIDGDLHAKLKQVMPRVTVW